MVKKKGGKFEFSKIGSLIDDIAKKTPIFIEKEDKNVERISTGVYILNACLSGSIYGGVKGDAITVFAGPESSGKTFLSLNTCREAQKLGYGIIYIDTENSIERSELYKYGIDNSLDKFILLKTNKVEDINMTLTQLLDGLKEQKLAGVEIGKVMIVIDSLAQMASNKEKEDLISGRLKQDMTKAKALGSLFRSITIDLGYLDIPMIVNNQTYKCVIGETKVLMSNGDYKMIKNINENDYIQTLVGEEKVNFIKKYDNATITKLTLENGQTIECTNNHKFLIKEKWSNDENDSCWIDASDLKENDVILSYQVKGQLMTKNKRVIKVETLKEKKDVYDINVNNTHHYIIENGVVTHNTMDMYPQEIMKGGKALYYSASNITFLSKAKLKTGEEDEYDFQSGIIVTAKAMKNRQAKPKKVKFEISFEKGCNPYVGLDMFCIPKFFDRIGIAKGKFVKYDKPVEIINQKTGEILLKEGEINPTGNRWYIKHLDKSVFTKKLFTPEIFTPEVLKMIEPIANAYFRYRGMDEINEVEDEFEERGDVADDTYQDLDLDDISSEELFE